MNDSPIAISVYRCPERLHTPYVLSFGTVEQLDTYYVMVEGGGRVGFGEITPLPGYSDESAETVEAALADTMLKFGTGGSPWEIVESLSYAPFVASGFATALELWETEGLDAFTKPLPGTIPLIALCQAENADESALSAKQLIASGYRCLKMKLGQASIDSDISRVRAAASQLPRGAELRLDANQGLARHRPSLAKSQRACRQSLAWGKRGRAKLARIYHRPINSNFLLKIIGHVPVLLGHFD